MKIGLLLVPVLVAVVVAWLVRRPRVGAVEREPRSDRLVLCYTSGRIAFGAVLAIATALLFIRAAYEPDPAGFWVLVALFGAMEFGAGVFLSHALRCVLVSKSGIEIVTPLGRRFVDWHEIASVEGRGAGQNSMLVFTTGGGRKFVLDAGQDGWDQLLRRLGDLAAGDAKQMSDQAVNEIKRWQALDAKMGRS